MRPKYTREYVMTFNLNQWEHMWKIVGEKGGCHLSIRPWMPQGGPVQYSAGLECHWRTPPEFMEGEAPSNIRCWLLESACWHDGTSSYASDHFVPIFTAPGPTQHERIFDEMESWADDQLTPARPAEGEEARSK